MTPEADLWPAHEQAHSNIPPTPAPYTQWCIYFKGWEGEVSASLGLIENDYNTVVLPLPLGEYQDI